MTDKSDKKQKHLVRFEDMLTDSQRAAWVMTIEDDEIWMTLEEIMDAHKKYCEDQDMGDVPPTRGELLRDIGDFIRFHYVEVLVECKTCDGTGEVHSHNPQCWTCSGRGYTIVWRNSCRKSS